MGLHSVGLSYICFYILLLPGFIANTTLVEKYIVIKRLLKVFKTYKFFVSFGIFKGGGGRP